MTDFLQVDIPLLDFMLITCNTYDDDDNEVVVVVAVTAVVVLYPKVF
jgi:hypothetical protein